MFAGNSNESSRTMSEVVHYQSSDRIGRITIDSPPVNALSTRVRDGLVRCFSIAAGDDDIDAVLLSCAGRTFIAGADISELGGDLELNEAFALIEGLEKPVVAALHGTALGGGAEAALACHYRVAAADARVGFPEITLGIVPGAGATQRLPRLIGARPALELLLSGRFVTAAEALDLGLIDAVADGELQAFALAFTADLIGQRKGPRRVSHMRIEADPATADYLRAERDRLVKAGDDRVVPLMDVDAVEAALALPFAAGLAREKEISDASLDTVESRAMRRLFFAERQTTRIPGIDPELAMEIRSGAIIGAGTMGRGIAMAFANSGLPVLLLDVDQASVDKGLATIRGEYEKRVQRGRMNSDAAGQCIALIRGSVDYADIAAADVVIEAVFESMALKKDIFARMDEHCKAGAILASNTSTLDIEAIAAATRRPQDVVGLHFFSPAQVMRLLEVVRSEQTSDAVIATAMKLAGRLRKIGVLSANAYGFIGNRMMDPYGREAEHMLLEGATPQQVDAALERFGMAMGILAVFDMAGVDVGVRVREERAALLPDDPGFYRTSALLVANGMLGQKSGAGYYRYEKGSRERHENPDALALFAAEAKRLGIEQREIGDDEIVSRCLCALINEGAQVLEEGVALRAADIDVAYTAGYGFPRHRGGPMFHGDTLGLEKLIETMAGFAGSLDARYWQPSPLLVRLAESGGKLADVGAEP
jgi:3-hydroxyacyl-CoA dehydrogenase